MTEKKYQIGIVQARFANGEIKRNLEKMKEIVEKCKERSPKVKLMLFPELAATGYFLSSAIRQYAETPNGWIARYLSEVARKNKMYISYGYVESGSKGEIFNSLRFIDNHGKWIANYRKIHITELERGIFSLEVRLYPQKRNWGISDS